jgi:hypothetical protein
MEILHEETHMKTLARLIWVITALGLSGTSYARPSLFDTDISVYYKNQGTGVGLNFRSSKHDTEEAKSTLLSWIDENGNYYSCTSTESALIIPRKAKTGSASVTVDPNTWTCSSFDQTAVPAMSLAIQCKADGLNSGTGTGKSKRTTSRGLRKYVDRYHSNSATCQVSVNGAAPLTAQGWLTNKQSR